MLYNSIRNVFFINLGGIQKLIYLLLTVFVGCLLSGLTWADSSKITFETLLKDVAPGEIQELFQDDKGFMWLGGRNYLLRYNAYEFEKIYIDEGDANKENDKSPQFTTDIFQDSKGKLWITSHSGLFWFNQATGFLVQAEPANKGVEPLYSENIHSINELPSGELIVGLNYGFAIIDPNSLIAEYHGIGEMGKEADAVTVYNIKIDSQQRIWLGTRKGLYNYDHKSNVLKHYIPDPNNPDSPVDNSLWSLEIDKNGDIWGGTLSAGLYIFNPESETFRRFRAGQDGNLGFPEDAVLDIMRDSNDDMWIAHDRSGFSKFNLEKQYFENYFYLLGQPGSLLYNAVRAFYEDTNGDIWIGHYPGGISFHDKSSAAIKIYYPNTEKPDSIGNENISSINEDAKGNLWIGVGDGVDYFDRNKGSFTHYRKNLGNYPANGTLSGYLDKNGQVWIGTWTEGYHKYNPLSDQFEAMPVEPSLANSAQKVDDILNDATIWTFCDTRDGSLWIGTHNAGISRYDREAKTFTKYINENTDVSLSNNIAWSCYEDSKGRLWIGTAWGLSLMDRENETFKSYRPQKDTPGQFLSGSIMSICEDDLGRMWFGTEEGLYLYREESDDFKIFTTKDGISNQGIRAITVDLNGNLWLGTNKGISQFNPETYKVKNYLEHGGRKISGINTGAALTSKSGEVIFGSIEGLIVINVEKLSFNKNPPPVVLTDFRIYTKSVPVNGPDNILQSVVSMTDNITLDYTKQMFSFEFTALNYRTSSKNQYAYKLEGFDDQWREIGTQRKAQYTNLSAGNYVFRVRASNNDGVWNDEGASIRITQLPPPWKTWWAYLIYCFLVIFALGYFVQLQKRKRQKIEEQNRLLEIKVAERTKDLAEKNKDIQAMLSNMKQGLLTIETSGNIHHEYSAYLETIYETDKIANSNVIEFMFGRSTLNEDTVNQIDASISSIIGLDQMNYDFNSHLLVQEYTVKINDNVKILSLDWSAILDDGNVSKLMVSVRDVTELKELEHEAEGKKRELDIISQLLNVSNKKYKNFINTSLKYLTECKGLIQESRETSNDVIATLFRNMHTVKGNSRTHGFTHISNAAHCAESTYSEIKAQHASWDQDKLVSDLEKVFQVVEEYNTVYRDVLGREEGKSREDSGVWINHETLESIQTSMDILSKFDKTSADTTSKLLYRCMAAPLHEVLSNNVKALSSIAEELGKDAPAIDINDGNVLIKEAAHNLFTDVFSHLLRNSLDHGIESPEERKSKSKTEKGKISIDIEGLTDRVQVLMSDDGRGLDIQRLYTKGCDQGLWQRGEPVPIVDIANMIFHSGVSTKETVSEISGRGVGMDAVKQFLENSGGTIQLQVENGEDTYNGEIDNCVVSFKTCILLPKKLFLMETASKAPRE
ncbi:chemotaxis protein histidine kinase CheA [Alteromonadaceae bacterium 2753L.S.0a.02]|nr:chemotaxis protein histidine kinase CheA [Alteromonadaceae bacterium 2753L.S.0a.02]